jgi:hypothetical protein
MEPPASLTSVRVKRRQTLGTPSGKRGDLTDGGDTSVMPEAPPAPPVPMLTQAAMDADHQATIAQEMAAEPPAEPVHAEPVYAEPVYAEPVHTEPVHTEYQAPQPVIVLPPPVLNGEDRDALLPMAELLPEVTAAMHEQSRQSDEAGLSFAVEAPEPPAQTYQPEYLLSSPLPTAPASPPEPEVFYQRAVAFEPEVGAPEVIHQPEAMHEPVAMHEPEAIVHSIIHAEAIAEPETLTLYEPEIIAEPESVAQPEDTSKLETTPAPEVMPELEIPALEIMPEEGDGRREPVLTMPPAEASDTVIPLPVPVAAAEPPATEPEAKASPDLLDYWDGLRGARELPAVDELDRSHIAGSWPNIVLLGFTTELPQITRIGENNGDVEYTAMVTSWLMSRGRHAVKRGEAMEEEQKFPISTGSARYRLLLLPMMGRNSEVCDHVLCQITRAQERSAGFSFKRWLAS